MMSNPAQRLTGVPERDLRKLNLGKETGGVSIIGFSSSGKTVFTTLLVKYLEKKAKLTGYASALESGHLTIMRNSEILSKGSFPPKEAPGTVHEPVRIRLTKAGRSVTLEVNDIQGEVINRLESGEVPDPVAFLLTWQRGAGSAIGPLSSVVQAKGYAVAIDCAEFSQWDHRQYQYANILKLIVDMKGGNEKTRLSNPLALLFTKCDLLPEKLSANQLLAKLDAVNNYVDQHFDRMKVGLVAVRVEVQRLDDGSPKVTAGGAHMPKIPLELEDADFLPFVDWALKWL